MLILKQKLKIKFDHSNREKNSYPYVCIIVPLSLHHTPFKSLLLMKFIVFWLSFTKLFGCVKFTVYVYRSICPSQGDSTQMLKKADFYVRICFLCKIGPTNRYCTYMYPVDYI